MPRLQKSTKICWSVCNTPNNMWSTCHTRLHLRLCLCPTQWIPGCTPSK